MKLFKLRQKPGNEQTTELVMDTELEPDSEALDSTQAPPKSRRPKTTSWTRGCWISSETPGTRWRRATWPPSWTTFPSTIC